MEGEETNRANHDPATRATRLSSVAPRDGSFTGSAPKLRFSIGKPGEPCAGSDDRSRAEASRTSGGWSDRGAGAFAGFPASTFSVIAFVDASVFWAAGTFLASAVAFWAAETFPVGAPVFWTAETFLAGAVAFWAVETFPVGAPVFWTAETFLAGTVAFWAAEAFPVGAPVFWTTEIFPVGAFRRFCRNRSIARFL
jgi:hypothetical protein